MTADLVDRAVLGVADAHAGNPVASRSIATTCVDNATTARNERRCVPPSWCAGVVDDGVVVTNATDQRAALSPGSTGVHRHGSDAFVPERFARELVVEEILPAATYGRSQTRLGQREQEWQGLTRWAPTWSATAPFRAAPRVPGRIPAVRGSAGRRGTFRRAARGARREVACLDQRHLQPRVAASSAHPEPTTPPPTTTKSNCFGAKSLQAAALSRSKSRSRQVCALPGAWDRVAHHKGLSLGKLLSGSPSVGVLYQG